MHFVLYAQHKYGHIVVFVPLFAHSSGWLNALFGACCDWRHFDLNAARAEYLENRIELVGFLLCKCKDDETLESIF